MGVPDNHEVILIVEDNEDHFLLARDALREAGIQDEVRRIEDGEALFDYLKANPLPYLILLDLNLPKKDGREALREIKSPHSAFRHLPVIVLTTSKIEEDVLRSYELGASSFIKKPPTFDELVHVMEVLKRYWLEIAELPTAPH
jgi:CheY-like chemotaxis protein